MIPYLVRGSFKRYRKQVATVPGKFHLEGPHEVRAGDEITARGSTGGLAELHAKVGGREGQISENFASEAAMRVI